MGRANALRVRHGSVLFWVLDVLDRREAFGRPTSLFQPTEQSNNNTLELVPLARATPVPPSRYCTAFGVRMLTELQPCGAPRSCGLCSIAPPSLPMTCRIFRDIGRESLPSSASMSDNSWPLLPVAAPLTRRISPGRMSQMCSSLPGAFHAYLHQRLSQRTHGQGTLAPYGQGRAWRPARLCGLVGSPDSAVPSTPRCCAPATCKPGGWRARRTMRQPRRRLIVRW